MENLVTSEAAYLYAATDQQSQADTQELVAQIADVMVEKFGAFLMLEIWPARFEVETDEGNQAAGNQPADTRPRFRIVAPRSEEIGSFIDKFLESLSRIKIDKQGAQVEVVSRTTIAPPNLSPLLSPVEADQKLCLVLGLEIAPVFADLNSGEIFPQVRRNLESQLTLALKRVFFRFAGTRTTHRPAHYHALGRQATVKAVWQADQMLADVSDAFDFLLQLSPINNSAAWLKFQENRFQKAPAFRYRPLPVDPILLKRQLFKTPLQRVEDPAIGQLLRDKLLELDRQIGMLQDANTPQFVHGSIQLYGGVEDSLLAIAESILQRFPTSTKTLPADSLNAESFAALAVEEIDFLRRQDEKVAAKVEVRDDINGLIVSQGSLLIGSETSIPRVRAEALIQHEIGTHVLTYYNGRAQRFRQLSSGLSGYEALQEGIAVLAEFLVGGLNANRLRLLAARVIVVRMMIAGATFVECFEKLVEQYQFATRPAFNLTMRVFRGGGFTKDAIYLRGLVQTLHYLGRGGELQPLFIGKIAVEHIPIVQELRWRNVLSEPILTPRYMNDPTALERLERVRQGIDVLELIESTSENGGDTGESKPSVVQNK